MPREIYASFYVTQLVWGVQSIWSIDELSQVCYCYYYPKIQCKLQILCKNLAWVVDVFSHSSCSTLQLTLYACATETFFYVLFWVFFSRIRLLLLVTQFQACWGVDRVVPQFSWFILILKQIPFKWSSGMDLLSVLASTLHGIHRKEFPILLLVVADLFFASVQDMSS